MIKFVQMKDGFDPARECGLCGGPLNSEGDHDDTPLTLLLQFVEQMDRDPADVTPEQRYEALLPIANAARAFFSGD